MSSMYKYFSNTAQLNRHVEECQYQGRKQNVREQVESQQTKNKKFCSFFIHSRCMVYYLDFCYSGMQIEWYKLHVCTCPALVEPNMTSPALGRYMTHACMHYTYACMQVFVIAYVHAWMHACMRVCMRAYALGAVDAAGISNNPDRRNVPLKQHQWMFQRRTGSDKALMDSDVYW